MMKRTIIIDNDVRLNLDKIIWYKPQILKDGTKTMICLDGCGLFYSRYTCDEIDATIDQSYRKTYQS